MLRVPEKVLRLQIKQVLILLGYTVQEVGSERGKKKCPQCGAWNVPTGHIGNDVGVADLLLTRPAWDGLWIHLELKADKTRISREQKALIKSGVNYLCRSLAQALDLAEKIEERLGLENPKIGGFWKNNPRRLFE